MADSKPTAETETSTDTTMEMDAPAVAAVEAPTADNSAAPAKETSAASATETPATPAKETPATPAKETPATPAKETSAAPATESPAVSAADTLTQASPVEDCSATENGNKEQNGHSKDTELNKLSEQAVEKDPELYKKIVTQIEYYFGNFNLPRDKFLSAEVKKDDGWVPLTTMLKFARLSKLSSNAAVIMAAIRDCEESFMQVDDSNSKIRRSVEVPLPELTEGLQEDSIKRTIYCKGFPKDGSVNLDILLEYFKQFGEFDSIRIRNYSDKVTNAQGFKGSILVVFKTVELAKTFLERPPVQYKKIYLIRKWFADYLDEKRKEIEERRAKKQAKLDKTAASVEEKAAEFEEIPTGNFLRATGFAEGTMREDIKAAVFDLTNDCAFVDFRKGDDQAFIRFTKADSNKEILAALKDKLTVNGNSVSLYLVEGEEEEEQRVKANEARRRSHNSGPYQKKRKGYGFRGGKSKRQRI